MNSRKLLKQCFNCAHNVECWGLDREIPDGRNARNTKINKRSLMKLIKSFDIEDMTGMEYHCIRSSIECLNPGIGNAAGHSYTTQTMCVLEALANASNDFWCCPGDDEDNPRDFEYVPMRKL